MVTDMGDRVCDLECVEFKGGRHEFVGPVKIVIVEVPGEYQRKVWGAAVLMFAMLLMGATMFVVFAFTLRFKLPFAMNIHILLCTMGFQLFMPSGILMLNTLFGGAAPLKMLDKKVQHFFLQLCGLLTVVAGAVLLFLFEELKFTIHSYAGFAATVLTGFNLLISPLVCFTNSEGTFGKIMRVAHAIFGSAAFVTGTVCFSFGLWKESFIKWAIIEHFHIIVISLTAIYSLIVVASAWMRAKPEH